MLIGAGRRPSSPDAVFRVRIASLESGGLTTRYRLGWRRRTATRWPCSRAAPDRAVERRWTGHPGYVPGGEARLVAVRFAARDRPGGSRRRKLSGSLRQEARQARPLPGARQGDPRRAGSRRAGAAHHPHPEEDELVELLAVKSQIASF